MPAAPDRREWLSVDAHQEGVEIRTWDGDAACSVPEVTVSVSWVAGSATAAADALDQIAHRAKTQILETEHGDPLLLLGPQDGPL